MSKTMQRFRKRTRWCACVSLMTMAASLTADEPTDSGQGKVTESPSAKAASPEPIGVRFKGWLPGSVNPRLEGTFTVEFRIYRSPQGGEAVWREAQKQVKVKAGRIDVVLGTVRPIPPEIHDATFKFLGASVNGGREVYPRFPIVNVVYASTREVLLARGAKTVGSELSPPTDKTARGNVVASRGSRVSSTTEKSATWSEALQQARRNGSTLPDYEAWYAALESCTAREIRERTDHYEWVLPWVYDTASHGTYNRYFRGRFEGCDYMDLSPQKRYPYRIVAQDGSDRR